MPSMILHKYIPASPAAVWSVITDIPSAASIFSAIEEIEIVSGDRYAPGLRWREKRQSGIQAASNEHWVEEVVPEQSTTVKSESDGIDYISTFRLLPQENSETLLEYEFSFEQRYAPTVSRVLEILFGGIGMRAFRKAKERDLEDIAIAAETRP